jgi:hypothetical protein
MSKLVYYFFICWITFLLLIGAVIVLPVILLTLPVILILLFAAMII